MASSTAPIHAADKPAKFTHCRVCTCRLNAEEEDDFVQGVCGSCSDRPEARRLGIRALTPTPGRPASRQRLPRAFTAGEKSLIQKVHGYMPAQQLLGILNERLKCDQGPNAAPYTMEQLHAEIGHSRPVPKGGYDWAGLRQLLSRARRSGVLDRINEQLIDDFAVVYSLNQKQVLVLKDIVLQAKGD